ncbi:uncharacterized protein LOC144044773 [Vanacampus margaritifer]
MEESYETFEEELGPPREDLLPQKPVRQIRRPEMYASRKLREEMSAVPQPPKVEPKTLPMEPTSSKKFPEQKAVSMQNLSQIETPWENVTLNRCLFVAISILVLTSGFHRLHETLRGHGTAEEEENVELTVRQSNTLRHRGKPPQPETNLWEVLFWWLPDLDDDDEDEDDEKRRGTKAHSSRGLRNKPMPDKKLMKQSEGTLKSRRAKKVREQEDKKVDALKAPHDEADEQKVENEEVISKAKMEKKKKKTQKE